MHNLGESMVDVGEGAIAQHLRKLNGCGDLKEGLDLIQRLAMGGIANAETVKG